MKKLDSGAVAAEDQQQVEGRVDRKGTPIVTKMRSEDRKMKSKHKVTFIDQIDSSKDLCTTHLVLSYKKYNSMNTFDPYEFNENDGQNGQ